MFGLQSFPWAQNSTALLKQPWLCGKASEAGQVSMQITWSEQRAFEKLLHVSPRVLLYPATCFCCNFQEALKWLGNPRHPQETSATLLQHGPSVLWAVSSQPFHHMPISKNNKVRYAIYSCWTLSQFHVHVNHFGQCKTEAKGIKNAKHSGACTVIVVTKFLM